MASESTTGAVLNGERPLGSNEVRTARTTYDKQDLRMDRLEAFLTIPIGTIIASDLDPEEIPAVHGARIDAELAAILPYLPQV
ncbi:hypothetical protein F4815DRAFT_448042 [Daldinia loculata]|uniref:uncharacterized protein n=1 Tax=Daldinia loculata TaxID=103429 RepID=UPI0020C2A817|nr:uncharacterized protein F4817DRAFT_319558 [Daldinia loculata]KAI1643677.1 hypothetical protein F4817DRAFT_319558 [Daldinia loculata]KAI2777651.1 hypothetical protein F4815DRAFT_448042 [Daldinia loculata]